MNKVNKVNGSKSTLSKSLRLLIIIPTITGREKLYNRCIASIELAYHKYMTIYKTTAAKKSLGDKYVKLTYDIKTEKDSTRENILKSITSEEFNNYDYINFIDDDDYVDEGYFYNFLSYEFYRCIDLYGKRYIFGRSCRRAVIKDKKGNIRFKESDFIAPYSDERGIFKLISSKKCTPPAWYITGLFIPAELIKEFVTEVLTKYDIRGCWEDLVYQVFFEIKSGGMAQYYEWHYIGADATGRCSYDVTGTLGSYYQDMTTSSTLTRNNPDRDADIDRNLDIVKDLITNRSELAVPYDEQLEEEGPHIDKVNSCINRFSKAYDLWTKCKAVDYYNNSQARYCDDEDIALAFYHTLENIIK